MGQGANIIPVSLPAGGLTVPGADPPTRHRACLARAQDLSGRRPSGVGGVHPDAVTVKVG